MNQLEIYSNKWFNVSEWGYRPWSPCAQLKHFWNFRTLERAKEKLEELWGDYRVYDYRGRFAADEELEAKEYSD